MGDFNAKLGRQRDGELRVGEFGYGQRNSKGQRLAEFLGKEDLFMMNSFFQKPPQRKWTWMSPDGSTKNEIDFIVTTDQRMFSDVSKTEEYNLPLCLAFVDYEKASDSIETWAVQG
ncbi:hypothetical protein ABMA27_002257 [Loxostege sticticalis]|uniref:Craniofacial development protein 2-like n=1 Tax=Loxostege sticticalis TaxID=481309 RepID=A0ABR3HX63_LOXSC